MMNGNGWVYRKVLPLGGTVLFLGLVELLRGSYISYTLAIPFFAVVGCAYLGGLWTGFIAASLVSAYAFYGNADFWRNVQVILALYASALMVGGLQEKVKRFDNADTVLGRMWALFAMVQGAVISSPELSEHPGEMFSLLKTIHRELANILTLAQGWRDLAEERKKVIDNVLREEGRHLEDG